ncbi:hypothetical protein N0B16_07950 [Chryseobacterium sp. GMJ5]|uniref:Uncharacterized protein n=1 Tax=Chryseobacterium gilvum TaxID=2976534 RepID=A0ABT2VWJ0_9FLAO|nr:hypothetical protein [Chryseobacterium gilvum]MCU7614368.1 hypothetical protein [Chryseobacterium gilvum]
MKKSQFILVSQLKEKLQGFPAIVSSLETKDPYFVEKVFSWLKAAEDIFSTYNISEVSEIAGFRSKILASKLSDERGANTKKNQVKTAAANLYTIQNTVLNVLLPYEHKMNECRSIVKQLLVLAIQTGTLQYDHEMSFEDFVKKVWQYILSNPNLISGAIQLKSALSETDIIMLIADEIDLNDFS